MTLSFRRRILLMPAFLLALLAVVGASGVVLFSQLEGQINTIPREKYESIVAMERLQEALERIDSSFHFAMAGHEERALEQYRDNWKHFHHHLERQQPEIATPGEAEQVKRLITLTDRYQRQGDAFFVRTGERTEAYFGAKGQSGLLDIFKEIKEVSGQILALNLQSMEQANRHARETAGLFLTWFGLGLAVALTLAVLLAAYTIRATLGPVRAMTQSALAIGSGNLNQVVPVMSEDEFGQLAQAFNTMARQLRDFHQTRDAQLLRARQSSQTAIDSLPQAVWMVDCDGRVEMANPAARRILGIAAGEKQLPASSDHELSNRLWQPLADVLRNHRSYLPKELDHAIQLRHEAQDGYFLPHILPIGDQQGDTLGAVVLLEEVTRFRLQDQLKSDLVATASHQLKTPLATIRLAIHWLLDETLGPLNASQLEAVVEARDNSGRLLATIDNLLDLARLEQGQRLLDLQPAQPLKLLETAREAMRHRAEENRMEIGVEASADLPRINIDVEAFGQVLLNLIDNALIHTGTGGRITLAAASSVSRDAVVLSVADTGVGIPQEHLPHLFDKFFRVPGQLRGSGTGLGLPIAREIVAAHRGAICCDSRPGEGTVFRITLPAESADTSKAIATPQLRA